MDAWKALLGSAAPSSARERTMNGLMVMRQGKVRESARALIGKAVLGLGDLVTPT